MEGLVAVFAVLIGGLTGFMAFLTALLAFQSSFLSALGLYSGVGLLVTLVILLAGLTIAPLRRRARVVAEHEDLTPAGF